MEKNLIEVWFFMMKISQILVSRFLAKGKNCDSDLLLDINIELFPIRLKDKFIFSLSQTLSLDGSTANNGYVSQGPSLADKYDYVMFGKVYKCEEANQGRVAIYVSFGGLLMRLEADSKYLFSITLGTDIYLLMKKSITTTSTSSS